MLDGGESKVASEDDLKSSLHLRTSDEIESLMMFAYQALHSPFSNKLYQFCQVLPAARIRTNLASLIGGVERAPSEP